MCNLLGNLYGRDQSACATNINEKFSFTSIKSVDWLWYIEHCFRAALSFKTPMLAGVQVTLSCRGPITILIIDLTDTCMYNYNSCHYVYFGGQSFICMELLYSMNILIITFPCGKKITSGFFVLHFVLNFRRSYKIVPFFHQSALEPLIYMCVEKIF